MRIVSYTRTTSSYPGAEIPSDTITRQNKLIGHPIQQSTISEWKKNRTNPSSDKILAICRTLDVPPEWLLSGVDPAAGRGKT